MKTALVIGANGGLGKAAMEALTRAGFPVYAADTKAPAKVVDVTKEETLLPIMETFLPDIVVNCAGITGDGLIAKRDKSTGFYNRFPMDLWQKVIDVNLTGSMNVLNCWVQARLNAGCKGGVIINVSSVCAAGNLGQPAYSASKAGLNALTVCAAKELARYGIRVNAIAPGYMDTEMMATIPEKVLDKILSGVPLARLGKPEEFAAAVMSLVAGEFYTGTILDINGGLRL